MKRQGKSVLVLIIMLSLCAVLCGTSAAGQIPPAAGNTVRVGYFRDGDYLYKDKDGSYRGYEAEYLYNIAQYANWKLVFSDLETGQT